MTGFESRRVHDLAQDYWAGMPHHPNHPPFLFGLTKKHGDFNGKTGVSSAADSISLSGHTGTHIDALCHFSCHGRLWDGKEVRDAQSYSGGIERLSIATVEPILRRGVLLDVAGLLGVPSLAPDFSIGPEHLEDAARKQGVAVGRGDVVLVRTGWGAFFGDPARYLAELNCPGVQLAGARWLSRQGVFAVGSDTIAFERVPDPEMPVHVHLLVESGIHIIENLALEQLAGDRCHSFRFVAAPLKIRGGTGSPVRPLALAD